MWPVAKSNVNKILFSNQANVLMLQETKCKSWSETMIESVWNLQDHIWVEVPAARLSGGLVISWERNLFSDYVVVKNKHWIWIRGTVNDIVINLVNVYAPLALDDKRIWFGEINNLVNSYKDEPLCLLGDFNSVRSREERQNFIFKPFEGRILEELIEDGGLWDIPLSSHKFTWFGPQGKKSKLDRAIVNFKWLENYQWHLRSFPRQHSDHRPLFLFSKVMNWGSKPFKAFNVWIKNERLSKLIHEEIISSSNDPLFVTLKKIKKVIKQWNLEDNGDINRRIKDKEVLLDNIDSSDSDSHLQSQVVSELQSLYQEKSSMLIQQSRVKWDLEGDRNSKFFHQVVKFRNNRNTIKVIKEGDVKFTDPEDIKKVFFNHFHNFFNSNGDEIIFNLDNLLTKKLPSSKAKWLERKFSKEEIWMALQECPSLKAPGPYGLNAGWIKSFWNTISGKIEFFFEEFFLNSFIPRGSNSSFFTLIPKKNCPESVLDFRPISLINSSFKILLKVLANRISSVIDPLVSNSQSAFVKGRNISDGILLTNEIVKDMQNKLYDGIITKLDFAKAYDSVNWGFLFHVLNCLGFSKKWISWMSSILSSSRISVLVNGSPSKEFSPHRGIRQGDPLALYLFLLISEVLHVLLDTALEKKVFEGATFKDGRRAITHLQYADDTILFLKANMNSILGVKKVLLLFQTMSGLSINFDKSQIFDANNEVNRLEPWALALGCQIGKIPFTYLGASIGKNIKSKSFWDPLNLSF